jgi:hypothetical protein
MPPTSIQLDLVIRQPRECPSRRPFRKISDLTGPIGEEDGLNGVRVRPICSADKQSSTVIEQRAFQHHCGAVFQGELAAREYPLTRLERTHSHLVQQARDGDSQRHDALSHLVEDYLAVDRILVIDGTRDVRPGDPQEHEIWILDYLGVDVLDVQPQSFLARQGPVPPPDDPVHAQARVEVVGVHARILRRIG